MTKPTKRRDSTPLAREWDGRTWALFDHTGTVVAQCPSSADAIRIQKLWNEWRKQ